MKCPGGPQYDLGQALETPDTSHELAMRVERTRHGSNCESLLISAMVLYLFLKYSFILHQTEKHTETLGGRSFYTAI